MTTVHEILLILIRMEPDLVARQNTFNQLLAHRKRSPKVLCWKGRMQGKSNSTELSLLLEPFPQQSREKHKMVIMHPDEIAIRSGIGNRFGK